MYLRFIEDKEIYLIKQESISAELKVFLTRKLRRMTEDISDDSGKVSLIKKNGLINKSKTIRGEKIYVLECDDWGEYITQEYAWHNSEFELVFRHLNNIQFFEYVGELIEDGWFYLNEINNLLKKDNSCLRFFESENGLKIQAISLDEVEKLYQEQTEVLGNEAHPNINSLLKRAEIGLSSCDYPLVLQSCGSIFETLSKDIIDNSNVETMSFGWYFEKYKQTSKLPEPILEYMKGVFNDRNTSPLAGHGSTQVPTVNKETAIILIELTKAFVQSEYRLKKDATVKTVSPNTQHSGPSYLTKQKKGNI